MMLIKHAFSLLIAPGAAIAKSGVLIFYIVRPAEVLENDLTSWPYALLCAPPVKKITQKIAILSQQPKF